MEVASQFGDNTVRCIALEATEGVACGMKAVIPANR
jgi:F-type H+-transporting ATPase subunit beta